MDEDNQEMVTNNAPRFEYFQKYLKKYSLDEDIQRDIFQDACVKFYENTPNWDNGFPYGYFHKAIYWKANEYLRTFYTKTRPGNNSDLLVKVDYKSLKTTPPQIIEQFDDKFERDELLNLILPEAPIEITMYLDGYSIDEIAKKVNKSSIAVRLVRYRFIQKMKEKYNKIFL